MDQAAERIESLKAGWVGAAAATIMFVATVGVRLFIPISDARGDVNLFESQTLASAAIAVLSGGLFGITYRYILRSDDNTQLQLGAVGAFGLVRGLAQIETTWATEPSWFTALKLLASLLMFAAAALVLNWAMQRGWVKQFGKSSPPASSATED